MREILDSHFLLVDLVLASVVAIGATVVLVAYFLPVDSNLARYVVYGALALNGPLTIMMNRARKQAREKADSLPCFDRLRQSETFGLIHRTFREMLLLCGALTVILALSFLGTFISADYALTLAMAGGMPCVLARVTRSLWIIGCINEIEKVASSMVAPQDARTGSE